MGGGQYQDIQTTQGSWYGPVEMILPEPEPREISFPLVRTISKEQSVYSDVGPISVTIVFIEPKTRI